jgi:hypothetical protein
MCRLSWNLRALNSWNPQGLSKSAMGLLTILYIVETKNSRSASIRNNANKVNTEIYRNEWKPVVLFMCKASYVIYSEKKEQKPKVAEREFRVTPVLPWEVCQLCTRRSKVTFRRLNSIRSKRLDTLVGILIRFCPVLHIRQSVRMYPGFFLTGIRKIPGTQKF